MSVRSRPAPAIVTLLALAALALLAGSTPPPAAAQAATQAPTAPPAAVPDSVALNPGPWSWDLPLSLFLNQSSYSGNWSGGDQGSVSWSIDAQLLGERQFSTRFNWKNTLRLSYGQSSRQVRQDDGSLAWDTAEKTNDQITFESLARWTLGGWADPYAALRVESQFRDESSEIGTIWLNPVKLIGSAGIAKVFRKTKEREFITRLGLGVRETLGYSWVSGPPDPVKDGFSSTDAGLEWYTTMREPILNNRVEYYGELMVFAPFLYSKSDALQQYDEYATANVYPDHTPVGDYWRVPDVNWRNTLSSKITKAISVNLFWQLVYDKFDTAANVDPAKLNAADFAAQDAEIQHNVRLAGQWKQQLAIGLTYSLF